MTVVRTQNFGGGEFTTAGSFVTLYTVPSDHRAVIKWWSYASTVSAPGVAILSIMRSGASHGLLMAEAALPTYTLRQALTYAVMEAGDELAYYQASVAGGGYIYPAAGGVLFELP